MGRPCRYKAPGDGHVRKGGSPEWLAPQHFAGGNSRRQSKKETNKQEHEKQSSSLWSRPTRSETQFIVRFDVQQVRYTEPAFWEDQ